MLFIGAPLLFGLAVIKWCLRPPDLLAICPAKGLHDSASRRSVLLPSYPISPGNAPTVNGSNNCIIASISWGIAHEAKDAGSVWLNLSQSNFALLSPSFTFFASIFIYENPRYANGISWNMTDSEKSSDAQFDIEAGNEVSGRELKNVVSRHSSRFLYLIGSRDEALIISRNSTIMFVS